MKREDSLTPRQWVAILRVKPRTPKDVSECKHMGCGILAGLAIAAITALAFWRATISQ